MNAVLGLVKQPVCDLAEQSWAAKTQCEINCYECSAGTGETICV